MIYMNSLKSINDAAAAANHTINSLRPVAVRTLEKRRTPMRTGRTCPADSVTILVTK
jgi:hypothetical protein